MKGEPKKGKAPNPNCNKDFEVINMKANDQFITQFDLKHQIPIKTENA